MMKEIILYNLADHVTDEQYKEYVQNEKGPLLDGLPGTKKFEMVKITQSRSGGIPYKYVGILHIDDMKTFMEEAVPSQEFQDFGKKWMTMVKDPITLFGEEIY